MSINRIIPEDDLEYHTIETYPSRSYSKRISRDSFGSQMFFTASNGSLEELFDTTGSVFLFSNRSATEKEIMPYSFFNRNAFNDDNLETSRKEIVNFTGSTNIQSLLTSYLSGVHVTTSSLQTQTKLEILRFTPGVTFNSNMLRKKLIIDHLMPYYRSTNGRGCNFGVNNYNSLHFFNKGKNAVNNDFSIPSNTAIIYPNPSGTLISSGVYVSQYGFKESDPFSFDFWIKPKYKNTGSFYDAGTILNLSGAYTISLHSGSSIDSNGKANKFKIALQLASGSTIKPSQLTNTDTTNNIFMSFDNSLEYNRWHHVSIIHGGKNYNNGSGSIFIDEINQGNFTFNNNGFALHSGSNAPDALCIGTFYEGPNLLANFFNANSSERDGLLQLTSDVSDPDTSDFSFTHPLEAELHDIKIYNKTLTSTEINYLQTNAPNSFDNLKFYLPPYFTEESPTRKFVGSFGGLLVTPFQEKDGTSTKPFSPELAFSVGGHYINIENYLRDFVSERYPRLWFLTGSSITAPSSIVQPANYFLYDSGTNVGSNKKRLYTILPCDHGNWNPNYFFLEGMSGSLVNGIYSNDLNNIDTGLVSLRNVIPITSITSSNSILVSSSILTNVLGAGPETGSLGSIIGNSYTILHRTKDNSSNQVAIFDISNLFYGMQIKPGTLVLTDTQLSGSDTKLSMILKDDSLGNLYRSDCLGTQATWNSVGNIFYNEGLIIINSPQLFFFGKDGFDISFKGIQNIHTLTINAFAKSMQLMSSSNPTYSTFDFSQDTENQNLANEPDKKYVFLTSVNIHDENLNVIMRTHFAQPIKKRSKDKILIKNSIDF